MVSSIRPVSQQFQQSHIFTSFPRGLLNNEVWEQLPICYQ